MFGRRVGAVVAVVVATLSLAGCSPGIIGITGLERTADGHRVLVIMCEGSEMPTIELRDVGGTEGFHVPINRGDWLPTKQDGAVVSFELDPESGFTDYIAEGSFALGGEKSGWLPAYVVGPAIKADKVDRLGVGEILAEDPRTWSDTTFSSRAEFVGAARSWCGELEGE